MSARFTFQPTLVGESITLRPLQSVDFEALYVSASNPKTWAGHPSTDRYQKPVFTQWFSKAIAANQTLVIENNETHQLVGSSRFYQSEFDPHDIAIGFTFVDCAYWGGVTNLELKWLMLNHALKHFDRVWFHISPTNIRSQKAIEKIGAMFSHQATVNITGKVEPWCFYTFERDRLALLKRRLQNAAR